MYKWDHSRLLRLAGLSTEKYQDLVDAGWRVRRADIERNMRRLLRNNYLEFSGQLRPA